MPFSSIVVGGTVAIDHVKTPQAEGTNLLGGSASFAALAASLFSKQVGLVGVVGHDFPSQHLDMLEQSGISLDGLERSEQESFTWTGEYFENMNERTTHKVGLNVLENWNPKVPEGFAQSEVVVLANMSPDNQLEMLEQCRNPKLVIADTMDLWIEIANERLHEVLKRVDIFVINESEARELAGTSNLLEAGQILKAKGAKNVVIKLGEFGAMLFGNGGGWHGGLFKCSAYPLLQVADPTGAGDSFLGAMAGYLASLDLDDLRFNDLKKAVVYGSVAASFTCEAFSTDQIQNVTRDELEGRVERLRSIVTW